MEILKNKIFFFYTLCLIISRIIINFSEINIFGISYGFHLLDKNLLHHDLAQSLYFLHSQPIGWNLFIGILTKVFNGNDLLLNHFIEIYHFFLTLLILKISILTSEEIFNNNKIKHFISLFVILNPSILFWEKIFSYQHTICALIFVISYLIIKSFKTQNNKYEMLLYFYLFVLSLIWSAFQPVIILLIFILFRFCKMKITKKGFIYFFLIFCLSVLPFIKNKIIFNSFTIGSWTGHQLSTTFLDWKETCDLPKPEQINSEEGKKDLKMYEKTYNRKFSHPSLVGETSRYNFVGIIYISQKCLKVTIERIINNPKEYLTGRGLAFLASHGKFAFDFMYPKPNGWNKYYKQLDELYSNPKYKLIRQAIIFTYMLIVYLFFFRLIFFSKENVELKKSYLVIFMIYLYLLVVGHLAAGHEQARMLYSGVIIHVLFYINVIKIYKMKFTSGIKKNLTNLNSR